MHCAIRAIPILEILILETYTVDINGLERKDEQKIKAVIPVHLFGNNSNMLYIKNM